MHLLICVAVFMHIVYLPQDAIQLSNGFSDTIARAYEQGKTDDKVGGIIKGCRCNSINKIIWKSGSCNTCIRRRISINNINI